MTIELTPEEAAAVYVLAAGELQAIKAEEELGDVVNENEINVLLSLANKTNPDPGPSPMTWEQIPAMEDEPD